MNKIMFSNKHVEKLKEWNKPGKYPDVKSGE